MKVKIVNSSENPLPDYSTSSSAGMDLRASLKKALTLEPLERKLIPTGLFMELPEGFEAQIRPRSGLALKKGISVLNEIIPHPMSTPTALGTITPLVAITPPMGIP